MKIKFLINEIKLAEVLDRLDSPKAINKFIQFIKENDLLQTFLESIYRANRNLGGEFKIDAPRMVRMYDIINEFFTDDLPISEHIIKSLSFVLKTLINARIEQYDLTEAQKALVTNWVITRFFSRSLDARPSVNLRLFLYPFSFESYFRYQRFMPEKYRDLMNVQTYDDAIDLINNAEEEYTQWISVNKSAKLKKESEYRKIFGDDNFNIYIPDNQQAACLLGMGTKWCTAALVSDNYYDHYHKKDDPLFILISTKDPTEKYQFHFGSQQFMNKDDDEIDISKFNEFMAAYHSVFSEYTSLEKIANKYHDDFSLNLRTEKEIKLPEFEIIENEYGKERKYIWIHYNVEYDSDYPPDFEGITHWYVPEWLYINMGFNYLNGTKESRRELENLISRENL